MTNQIIINNNIIIITEKYISIIFIQYDYVVLFLYQKKKCHLER